MIFPAVESSDVIEVPDVVVLIPALNEQATIGDVVKVSLELTSQVIVVSDGSSDRTVQVSRQAGAQVIEFEQNKGKGPALKAAVEASCARYAIMLDADLQGLKLEHLQKLLEPVVSGRVAMSIGIFEGGGKRSDFGNRVTPQLSGQRACLREWLAGVPDLASERWPEPAITRHLQTTGIEWDYVGLSQVSQVMKEQKRGFLAGVWARLGMYWELLGYGWRRRRDG